MSLDLHQPDAPASVEPTPAATSVLGRVPRSWLVILGTVGLATVGLMVTRPMFVAAQAQNLGAVTRLTGLLLVVLAFAWAVERWVERPALRAAVIGVPLAALAWWMVSPAFIDVTVESELPTSAADLGIAPAPPPAAPPADDGDAMVDDADAMADDGDAMADDGADEPATAEEPAVDEEPAADEPPATEEAVAPPPAAEPSAEPEPTQEQAEPAPPTELRRGSFRGLDGHDAEGQTALYRLDDGTHFIRLEDIDVDNGPGLQLYLVPGNDQTRPIDGSVFLGDLQGNKGSHNYAVPDWVTEGFLAGDLTVLIWCEPFSTAVGGATLS